MTILLRVKMILLQYCYVKMILLQYCYVKMILENDTVTSENDTVTSENDTCYNTVTMHRYAVNNILLQ